MGWGGVGWEGVWILRDGQESNQNQRDLAISGFYLLASSSSSSFPPPSSLSSSSASASSFPSPNGTQNTNDIQK